MSNKRLDCGSLRSHNLTLFVMRFVVLLHGLWIEANTDRFSVLRLPDPHEQLEWQRRKQCVSESFTIGPLAGSNKQPG